MATVHELLSDVEDFTEWADLSAYLHQGLVCTGRHVGGMLYPRSSQDQKLSISPEISKAMGGAMAFALAIVQGKGKAQLISEQLAGASRALAHTQQAIADAKTLAAIGEMAKQSERGYQRAVLAQVALHDSAVSGEQAML